MTHEHELVKAARTVARLETAQKALKRRLVEVNGKLRIERRFLRGLASATRQPNVAPSRLTGGATGHVMPPREETPVTEVSQATEAFMEGFEEPPMLAQVERQVERFKRRRRTKKAKR
jgi:hypothetical protein